MQYMKRGSNRKERIRRFNMSLANIILFILFVVVLIVTRGPGGS